MKTREDVARLMQEIFSECQVTRDAGQKEYAHDDQNALANFERTGKDIDIPREKTWYIFAKTHWDGILAYINGHRSQRENVRGRIKDLIVYLVLLWAMFDDDDESLMSTGFDHDAGVLAPQIIRCDEPHPNLGLPCKLPKGHQGTHAVMNERWE